MKPVLFILFNFCYFYVLAQTINNKTHSNKNDTIALSQLIQPVLKEVSGIADSKTHPGMLWAHEDSGRPPQLYLINREGQLKKSIAIKDVYNRDWEDMTLSNGYIYIGNIGDNARRYTQYQFFRFEEPTLSIDTIRKVQTIRFQYPDGAHDAEAFLVEPKGDITIITKRDSLSCIYLLQAPFVSDSIYKALLVGHLPFNGVVSAALSPDGRRILVKTYMSLLMYNRPLGMSLAQALKGKPTRMPYHLEPQGEAVSFALDGSGYFTLSEEGFSKGVALWYYRW